MKFKHLPVAVTLRIVSTVKGKPLTENESFNTKVQLMNINYPEATLHQVVEEDVKHKFEEAFRERLKKDSKLRNTIGGIHWSVQVGSLQFDQADAIAA